MIYHQTHALGQWGSMVHPLAFTSIPVFAKIHVCAAHATLHVQRIITLSIHKGGPKYPSYTKTQLHVSESWFGGIWGV
jgi:hypothetical protein